jgi:hypothetical protein
MDRVRHNDPAIANWQFVFNMKLRPERPRLRWGGEGETQIRPALLLLTRDDRNSCSDYTEGGVQFTVNGAVTLPIRPFRLLRTTKWILYSPGVSCRKFL